MECDTNMTSTAGMTTQATDEYSSSHTASTRCEAAFESSRFILDLYSESQNYCHCLIL